MTIPLEIRGIYTTALSMLALEAGWSIARPSPVMRERLSLSDNDDVPEVTVEEREDKQGVIVSGVKEPVEQVVRTTLERVPDALILGKPHPGKRHGDRIRYILEFPEPAKNRLDDCRRGKLFTLPGHHYLKVIDAKSVDQVEEMVKPEDAQKAAAELQERLVTSQYRDGRAMHVRHQKVGYGGFTYSGNIERFEKGGSIVLRRQLQGGGKYDSLDLRKEKGDFGTVEIPNGAWWLRRRYYRADGELKGEIYNINTPAELYPGLIYYVDLELDVVRWPDGRAKIVDQEILRDKREKGFIPAQVAERAEAEAERLMEELKAVPLST